LEEARAWVERLEGAARTGVDPGQPLADYVGVLPTGVLPNTTFRDGITESFAASPTQADHLYLTYEDWDPEQNQMDVKFTQSTNGGTTWSKPQIVNDNHDNP